MRKILSICKSVLLGTLIVVCVGGCGNSTARYLNSEESKVAESEETQAETQVETEDKKEDEIADVYVYVCGQILKPGVYILPEGSRVCDVFSLAGGLTDEAAGDYWNQARVIKDGEMIYVPTKEEALERQGQVFSDDIETTDTESSNKVNINTASKEELMTIPGIGEAKANAIIAYREENGPFSSIEELKNVEGIKDGVFSKMKDYIEIN